MFNLNNNNNNKQASATASSAVSPIQHQHWPSRPFIHIAVSPSAPVCVIHYISAFGGLLGCFPVCRSLDFQSLVSCLRPSWFFDCLCGAFPHRVFCYSVLCRCSCQFRAFLVGFVFVRGFTPQGFLLLSSLLVFSSDSSFPSQFCVFPAMGFAVEGGRFLLISNCLRDCLFVLNHVTVAHLSVCRQEDALLWSRPSVRPCKKCIAKSCP